MKENLFLNNIKKINQLIKTKSISCVELGKLSFDRIEKTKCLNAYITVGQDQGLEKAKYLDLNYNKNYALKNLTGIPISIKDNFCTKNFKTTCASKTLLNYSPPFDATVVEKLNDAILVGKTNLDEFAMGCGSCNSIFGPIKNPWNSNLIFKLYDKKNKKIFDNKFENISESIKNGEDWYIAGGSSGGSAVAVATGTCFAALASDTGGSTRNPASRTGVLGFKPSYGLISRYGLIPLTNSMDVPGIITRSVQDCETIFSCLKGRDVRDPTTVDLELNEFKNLDIKNLTIGIPEEYKCEEMSNETIQLWNEIADFLDNLGIKIKHVNMPHTKYSIHCYSILNFCEVASNFSCYDGLEYGYRSKNLEKNLNYHFDQYAITREESFNEVVKERIFSGNYFLLRENYNNFYLRALKVRRLIVEDFNKIFQKDKIDLLLTPVTRMEAPLFSEWVKKYNRDKNMFEDYCTQPVNMAGLPAISIPCKLSDKGLPLSLQLIAPYSHDYLLFRIAKLIETNVNFPLIVID